MNDGWWWINDEWMNGMINKWMNKWWWINK